MRTLDEIAEKVGLTTVDLLKIDAQGYELEILRGAEALLPHVMTLLFEVTFYRQYEGGALLKRYSILVMVIGI